MSGAAELRPAARDGHHDPARALALADYRLRVGGPADLVVFDAPTDADALRLVRAAHAGAARRPGGRPHEPARDDGRLGRRRGGGHLPPAEHAQVQHPRAQLLASES